jgi:hypothetical protein
MVGRPTVHSISQVIQSIRTRGHKKYGYLSVCSLSTRFEMVLVTCMRRQQCLMCMLRRMTSANRLMIFSYLNDNISICLQSLAFHPRTPAPLPTHCRSHSPISVQERSTLTGKKITVDDEHDTLSGATSSFQARSWPVILMSALLRVEAYCKVRSATLHY